MVHHRGLSGPALRRGQAGQSHHRSRRPRMSAPLSPVTLEVVRNGLYAIAEEMSVSDMRSARSPLLKDAGDLSYALTDAQGRFIAQGRASHIHLHVLGHTVKEHPKRV